MGPRGIAVSVLAIDTASRSRVVCVLASPQGELIDAAVIRGQPVGTSLPRMLMRMLDAADRAVVVVTGPGTYTGVRAGMAGALGVADARRLPLHGLGALEVAACWDAGGLRDDTWVIADAGRGALYVARRHAAATPHRMRLDDFDPGGAAVVSSESLPIAGLVVIDPAAALARAVTLALSRPALRREGLTAAYVDAATATG